ncbi:MobF family relaxase [Lacisediminihabitans changchengi]|uniref:MobF family relaxase n=1 Tax=Lacisediminihabitans changchengi TaxID=2787634 RepID=UPI0027DD543E|nr:MobF family relaxase [Lacisediminihabitans changchengi]
MILFRGSGADARRYLESDRSRADDYYLEAGTALAEFSAVNGAGEVICEVGLTPDEYAAWVDWTNPLTGESMGKPRLAGEGKQGSPRFMEMVVNTPKSLSIAAALHPEVSAALDTAQKDAVAEIRRWLGQHSVTRVGPRGKQEVVPVQQLETVSVVHHTSRAGDPHRHIHFQIGTRVWAAGAWRGLDTGALFRQQGAIRALGTAVIAAHPQLAQVLDAHGLTLDPVTGEVAELEPYNAVMSKRSAQVQRNLARFEADWQAKHPGQEPGPVVRRRLEAMAWDHERPAKKPATLGDEAGWLRELQEAGYTPDLPRATVQPARTLDELRVQQVASRALDRCAAGASTWTRHTVQENVTRIITEAGVRATPEALRDLVAITTRLAVEDCLSVLPPDTVQPDHVAHLTSLHVVAAETNLRDRLIARATAGARWVPNVTRLAQRDGLDPEQAQAAAAVAGTDPLVVVEGAAGAGKTTMLGAAIESAAAQGRATRIVTPTKKAADVATQELGVPTDSVAKLVHEHGFRWNPEGVWTRLNPGDTDPGTGATYTGPSAKAWLTRGERIVVDEAGMLDQDTALALLTVADERGTTLALVGDRAQLPAVGRGGVLDIAAQLSSRVFDMTTVHRFADPEYADLTVQMRRGEHPALLFDRLHALGLVRLHESTEAVQEMIAHDARGGDAITTATNDEARELNERIRAERVRAGLVDDARTTSGSDGLSIGRGDVIQTRQNDADVQVANRQTWIVQAVGTDGRVWAKEKGSERKQPRTVRLPAEYVAEHTHLAYATTAYGVQGATVPASHTVLSDSLDASGVYVGMTRGQDTNRLHVVAADVDDAREQFVLALERERADRGLVTATQAARQAVAGLTTDGPVRLVNAERVGLAEQIDRAERITARWKQVAATLSRQSKEQRAEVEQRQATVTAAETTVTQARAEVADPLIEQATADATARLSARERMWEASAAQRTASGLGKRRAVRAVTAAVDEHRTIERAGRARWSTLPETAAGVEPWAASVAQREADADPRVIAAQERAHEARQKQQQLIARQIQERANLRRQVFGDRKQNDARAQTARWQERADAARRDLVAIEALPVVEAAELIRDRAEREQAQREAAERALAERKAHAAQRDDFTRRTPSHGHTPRGRGLSL